MKDQLADLRTGGVTEAQLERYREKSKTESHRTKTQLSNGTFASSYQNRLWCVWGFKQKAQPGQ
jgi:hypothetical protein